MVIQFTRRQHLIALSRSSWRHLLRPMQPLPRRRRPSTVSRRSEWITKCSVQRGRPNAPSASTKSRKGTRCRCCRVSTGTTASALSSGSRNTTLVPSAGCRSRMGMAAGTVPTTTVMGNNRNSRQNPSPPRPEHPPRHRGQRRRRYQDRRHRQHQGQDPHEKCHTRPPLTHLAPSPSAPSQPAPARNESDPLGARERTSTG